MDHKIHSPERSTQANSQNDFRATAERLIQENAKLRRITELLRRSNQNLERFAFAASHDLQEPLRAITTYAELLAQRCGSELGSESVLCVSNIVENGKRMRALLADLLAYAEIGAPPDEFGQSVDLNIVLEKVRKNLKMAIDENGASVVSADLPTLSSAYEFHFVQLFQNLVGNAIKYRSEANPLVEISATEHGGHLEFRVADNGLGVAADNHQKIFEAFKRLHGNRSPGTGIGLAICQRVVERYGGRIWVNSQIGQGATFHFTLPSVEVHSRNAAPSERPGNWKIGIVVVDDNPADVSLLRLALEKAELNCELTLIEDGAEALAHFRQQGRSGTSSCPDLVVLDMNLPKSNGVEILKTIWNNRALRKVPVVILSSGLSPHDLATIEKFDFARYTPKPSSREDFLKLGAQLKVLITGASDGRSRGALA